MEKITSLTAEQMAKFPQYVKEWTDIGLSTEPADRPRAEVAIAKMYAIAGKKTPKIVWCGSPLSQGLTRHAIMNFPASVRDSVRDSVYGYHDANWLAFFKFFEAECGLTTQTEKLSGLWELAQSAGWALPHENICWVSERHTQIHQTRLPNGRYQLHCDTGPAVSYPDGWNIYYIHGVAVNEQIVVHPETLTLKQINDESNAEVRRIMVERYGYEKFLRESDAKLIDSCPEDHAMKGLRTAKLWGIGEIIMLDVLNSTPEPDGTTKRYVIPVDGSLYNGKAGRNCHAASASTWRKRGDRTQLVFSKPEDYAPMFES